MVKLECSVIDHKFKSQIRQSEIKEEGEIITMFLLEVIQH